MITSKWYGPGEDISLPLALRRQVFAEELGLAPEPEEAADRFSFHLVLLLNDVPVAAGRLGYGGAGTGTLRWLCVLKKYRRQGIGDGLVKILDFKASEKGMRYSQVMSTESLKPFYARIGYQETGETTRQLGLELTVMRKETNDGTREACAHQCPGP